MKILDSIGLMQAYAKATGKFCIYVSWAGCYEVELWDEIIKAAPYLSEDILLANFTHSILECDTEEEMNGYFDMTVGDDGPTKLNPYDGPASVYALTCNNKGELENENT